jgi:hypothetical protein
VLCYAVLIPVLLSQYVMLSQAPYRRVLPVLALIPMLRILSLTMPLREVPQLYWYVMVGTPLLVAVALTVRLLSFSWETLGLHLRAWPLQLGIGLLGIPLGIAGYILFRPEPLITQLDWPSVVIGGIILAFFTGLLEEIIFRGMLQQVTGEIFGRLSVLYSTALFAIMYIGTLSLSYMLFVGLVGLLFGICVYRTRSIWGVVIAHSLLNIGMLLIWPFFLP